MPQDLTVYQRVCVSAGSGAIADDSDNTALLLQYCLSRKDHPSAAEKNDRTEVPRTPQEEPGSEDIPASAHYRGEGLEALPLLDSRKPNRGRLGLLAYHWSRRQP